MRRRAELFDGGAGNVLLFDRFGAAIDSGHERGVRDPERGPEVSCGARAVELREHFDCRGRQRGVARDVRGELGAAVEDPPELTADDGRYGQEALERSVLAPRSL